MKRQANFVRFDQGSRDGFAGKNSSAVYVEGSAAKRLSSLAQEEFPRELSEHTRQNRERALRMNMSYVLFLTVAAFLTVFICINFLKLQAETTASQKELTKLEMKLSELKLANDSEYNRIISSVDLEEVKADAIERLGMTYAVSAEVRTYDSGAGDYVKQFREVPAD